MPELLERLQQSLAHRYAVERELGQGGMATVYLAEDLRHHRQVALKVLKPEIAATLGAGRFAREIEVAARLQHPNILPLLDSGEADGFLFYVMPFVEGESLRDRLGRGGELPIPDAVRILMEVADALSEAHAHGVVHRDIKPDNVMLRGRHALVTDFGVAKAVTAATGQQLLTSTGVALGTPTYMAPEQATADPHQDHRVDIYALGVLGYELLTGRAPYAAATAQEMLAAHVTAEPEPLERFRPTVSPALAAVITKCLAKKPADRWQSAEEVLTQLEPLATPSGGTAPVQARPTSVSERLPRWSLWAAAATGVVIVVLGALQVFRSKPVVVTAADVTQITGDSGVQFEPAISPDGNDVAYVAGAIGWPHLAIRSTVDVAGGGVIHLKTDTLHGSEWYPTWSADGQFVRFSSCAGPGYGDCPIWAVGKLGGAARQVWPGQWWTSWSPDGTQVAYVRGDTILVSPSAGTVAYVAMIQPQGRGPSGQITDLHSLAWSPDGTLIAYVNGNSGWLLGGRMAASSIWLVKASGGVPKKIVADGFLNVSPVWLDTKHLLFISNRDGARAVYVLEVGGDGPRGEPRAIAGISDPHSISYSILSHRLAYAKFSLRENVWVYSLDAGRTLSVRDGHRVTTGAQVIERHDISPDGRWLVYDSNLRGERDIFKIPVTGGEASALTDTPFDEFSPRWSPDGKEIAYGTGGESGDIIVMPADGGPGTNLTKGRGWSSRPSWSPSGLSIAFQSDRNRPPGQNVLWLVSRDSIGGAWGEPVRLTDFQCAPNDWRGTDENGILCDTGGELALISRRGRVLLRQLVVPGQSAPGTGLNYWSYPRFSWDSRFVYAWGVHYDGRAGVWALPDSGRVAARLIVATNWAVGSTGVGYISVNRDRLYLTFPEYESNIWVAKLKY